jgi:hypothetical protein
MTTDTQKVEAKGTAQHQEFAQRDAQTDNFQMAVMDDGEEDLKGSKDERVHMTDEHVSRISSNLFSPLTLRRVGWFAARSTARFYQS